MEHKLRQFSLLGLMILGLVLQNCSTQPPQSPGHYTPGRKQKAFKSIVGRAQIPSCGSGPLKSDYL